MAATVVCVVLAVFGTWVIVYVVNRIRVKSLVNKTKSKLSRMDEEIRNKTREAEKKIENREREFKLEKKEELQQLKENFEEKTGKEREELRKQSERLTVREESLGGRLQEIEKGKKELAAEKQELGKEREKTEALKAECREKLEEIAGLSANEAREKLLKTVKEEAQQDAAQIIQKVEREARETADEKAREIVATAIQRCAVDEMTERVIFTIALPNNEMKGRVIGREGRNIRTFEVLTGVDLIVDDTPETVTISCLDPLKREVARLSLERLIKDGRIHPARIKEIVEKAEKDVAEIVHEEGQKAAFDMGISDLPSKLIDFLGRLKFRISYGQNVLQHSKGVADIAGKMAAEMKADKADVAQAIRAGLLHDIGKASPENGSHALTGAELAKKCGESPEIVHAIAAHHEDEPIDTVLAALVQAADAISAGRPGARRETLEKYLKRVEELEAVAYSEGVRTVYVMRSGRELWVIVEPEEIDDQRARELSEEIADKIEKELKHPGQIKVTVIRELRAIKYAK